MLQPTATVLAAALAGQPPELVCPCPMMRVSPGAIFTVLVLGGLALAALVAVLISASVYLVRKSAR